jgi:hypothetical protein
MSQSGPELKVTDPERLSKLDPEVIEKVTSDSVSEPKIHSSETYLKPKRDGSPKRIEWSRELGKRSRV